MSTHASHLQDGRPYQPAPQSRLATLWQFVLTKVISSHGKRIIFLSSLQWSLYFQVRRIDRLEQELRGRVNKAFNLSTRDDALKLPIAIRDRIWCQQTLIDIVTQTGDSERTPEERERAIATRIVDISPAWVRYGPKTSMINEVVALMRQGPQLAEMPLAA